jgi:integrase
MGVQLREKEMKNGQISYYLDIYHNKARWYEFLNIHIQKNRPRHEDKEKKNLALQIKAKREHDLIVEDNGLQNRKKKLSCFVTFCEGYCMERANNGPYYILKHNLKKFVGNQSLSFVKITSIWIKEFQKFLLTQVCHNSTIRCMNVLKGALTEAVRQRILNRHPWLDLTKKEMLNMQDVFRQAFTPEQIQHLSHTFPVLAEPQIRLGYFFSCFTGLRWCDVSQLKWSEIIIRNIEGEKHYCLHFEQKKTEEIEYLPMSENAIEIIEQRQIEAEDEEKNLYVFPQLQEGKKSKYQKMRLTMKVWAKAAGIEKKKLHFHTGRHTFATNVLESSAEGDLYTVSKLLGHKNIKSTQIYAKVRDKRKLAAVLALPKIKLE